MLVTHGLTLRRQLAAAGIGVQRKLGLDQLRHLIGHHPRGRHAAFLIAGKRQDKVAIGYKAGFLESHKGAGKLRDPELVVDSTAGIKVDLILRQLNGGRSQSFSSASTTSMCPRSRMGFLPELPSPR
jgi:hypothetical protein